MRPQLHIIRIILHYNMCSAYDRKSLRGSAAASRARCGAAVGVLNGTYASKRTSGRFRARLPVGFSGEKSARAISRPEKRNSRFRSAVLVCFHRKPDTIRRRKTTKKNVSQPRTLGRSVARGLNLFSPRVGTLVSSVTHYLKTSRRRGPRAGGRLRRSRNYCCADGDSPVVGDNNIGHE